MRAGEPQNSYRPSFKSLRYPRRKWCIFIMEPIYVDDQRLEGTSTALDRDTYLRSVIFRGTTNWYNFSRFYFDRHGGGRVEDAYRLFHRRQYSWHTGAFSFTQGEWIYEYYFRSLYFDVQLPVILQQALQRPGWNFMGTLMSSCIRVSTCDIQRKNRIAETHPSDKRTGSVPCT